MQLAQEQRNLEDVSSPCFRAGRKFGEVEQARLWRVLQEHPACPSRVLLDKAAKRQRPMAVSLRQVNRWRSTWGRNRRQGRPWQAAGHQPVASGAEVVRVTPHASFVGGHRFAHGLDHHDALGPVGARLTQAVEAQKHTPPSDDFALWPHHESTLRCRFEALCFAPVVGLDRLPEFDTPAPPLKTLVGRGSQSATRSQLVGQRERGGAVEALRPALFADQAGPRISVDEPMIASWSRRSMPKGTLTMRGRIMAGSQAVMVPDDTGPAVFVAYSPPDIQGPRVMVAYGQQGAEATGSVLCVMDRAVHAVALAEAFDAQGWGLFCRLDDNEHAGLESVETTEVATLEEGTRVSSGAWKEARPDDPRHCVMVEPAAGKPLVDWGTPKIEETWEAHQWPGVSRQRHAMQERSGKAMIDHGALDSNSGRKTLTGPDRHHQRKQEQLEASLKTAPQRVDKQAEAVQAHQDKVAESASTGHGKRLEQRRRNVLSVAQDLKRAKAQQAQLAEQAATLGPAGQRADRDFRTQTIMTIRTLVLEHWLRAFRVALLAMLPTPGRLPQVLHRVFERSGARMETPSQVVYWINTAGLSRPNRRLVSEIVEGLCAMDLQDQGKPIHVRLKDMPP
jgi:hypothetical protein